MSTGAILTVLSNIPWGQVVENAPKVADGAAKLWSSVSGFRKKGPPAAFTDAAGTSAPADAELLRSRVQSLEEAVKDLSDQMQASSELIKALADQNTQLIQRIELNRVRLVRLGTAAATVAIVLVAAVTYLALRQ